MTEITDNMKTHKIQPSGGVSPNLNLADFFLALLTAPILVALLFFWAFLIPVFAVLFGYLPWLIFGGPALWLTAYRLGPSPWMIATGFVANALGTPVFCLLLDAASHGGTPFGSVSTDVRFMTSWGAGFSLAWSMAFWIMYRSMIRQRENTN